MAIPVLDHLFVRLQEAANPDQISDLQDQIWDQWLESGDVKINQQMRHGMEAMERDDYNEAVSTFSTVIEERPLFFEAWNKRATAYFLRGSYKQAIDDIQTTLYLEPRHFGALAGLAVIYFTIGEFRLALQMSERLLALIPNDDSTQDQVFAIRRRIYSGE